MDSLTDGPTAAAADTRRFVPLGADQRIEALDVVRGFALLGIFLMNIEWFNRPFATFNDGMPLGLTGLDWFASWFIAYFVQGKFWTIFSMLFGMGFAVMLVRAERAGREFTRVYLRRILALAVFGAAHYIFVWHGDILFSYAVGALALLIVLFGRAKPILVGGVVLIALGLVSGSDLFFRVAGGLGIFGLFALYLRGDQRVTVRGMSIPVFCVVLLLAGATMTIAAAVLWSLPDGPLEPLVPMTVVGPALVLTGWLAWRYHEPVEKRSVRMAVAIYVFGGVTMTAIGLLQPFAPDPEAAASAPTSQVAAAAASAPPAAPTQAAAASGAEATTAKTTPAQRATEIKARREKRLAERAADTVEELDVYTHGSYLDTVARRAREFPEKAASDTGFAVVLVAMFLIGVWFVRSGVMAEAATHLAFFRKLALYGLPVGIGLGLLGSLIATSHLPGDRDDGWGITRGLLVLGNLPASLGYVGLVVTMLYSRTAFARIGVLGPAGRMALTNYLTQSLLCMFVFDGFGLGYWGMPRAHQVAFVAVVFAAQVAWSHWWLGRFRYGPMEWLWRGFTYRHVPALRIAPIGTEAGEAT